MPDKREGKKRELKHETSILRKFHVSKNPDIMVPYYHMRDSTFDTLNAGKFHHHQLLCYYTRGI